MEPQEIPTTRILDRNLSRAAIASGGYTEHAAPALAKVVDEGVAVFERCSSTARGHDEQMGVLFPALHVFEMLDGINILLSEAGVVPANVLMRAAFEAKLSLEYIVENDTANRGAAYVVADIHRRIASWRRWDPESQQGKQFRAELRKSMHTSAVELPEVSDYAVKIASLESVLQKDHLKAAAHEYERVRSRIGKHPPFHALWNGPNGIQELARHLKRGAEYELLYRPWSNTSHAVDLQRQLTHQDGTAAVRVFRDPAEISTTYSLAISFGLETITALLNHYRPEEMSNGSYSRWYTRDIRDAYQALGKVARGRDSTPNGTT